jgi:hypothetical protein
MCEHCGSKNVSHREFALTRRADFSACSQPLLESGAVNATGFVVKQHLLLGIGPVGDSAPEPGKDRLQRPHEPIGRIVAGNMQRSAPKIAIASRITGPLASNVQGSPDRYRPES